MSFATTLDLNRRIRIATVTTVVSLAAVLAGCQAVDVPPAPDAEFRDEGDEWVQSATARAYDVEYDVNKGIVVSVRERFMDAEGYAEAVESSQEFYAELDSMEMPSTQMRVDYRLDGLERTTVQSLFLSEVAEDFLNQASKGYGAKNEPLSTVRFVLQTDREMREGDALEVELHAPEVFGTRVHHLKFTDEDEVIDDSEIGQTSAPLRRAQVDLDGSSECDLREVFPNHNRPNDENRTDLVFIGIEDAMPFRIEDYLVGMIDIYDDRAVMIHRDWETVAGSPQVERRGLFGMDPFRGNDHLFNFWYVPEPYKLNDIIDDASEDFCTRKLEDVQNDCFPDQPREYRIYIGSELDCRGTRRGDRVVMAVSPGDPYGRTRTLIHELGHLILDLADEYDEEGLGDRAKFPNCLEEDEMDRALELGFPDPQSGCSYTTDNIRPSEASVMRDNRKISFDELNQRWGCTLFAEQSGYHARGICSGSSLGYPSNYERSSCQADTDCSSGVCRQASGSGRCVAGHLTAGHRCDVDRQCLSDMCEPGLDGERVCYATELSAGSACRYSPQCDTGLLCADFSEGIGRCQPPKAPDEICAQDNECASNICSSLGDGTKACQDEDKDAHTRCYDNRECISWSCIYDGRLCTQPFCHQEPPTTPRFCTGTDLPPGSRCLAGHECRGYDPATGADCHDYSQGTCIQHCGYGREGDRYTQDTVCLEYGQATWDDCDYTFQCPAGDTCQPSAGPGDDEALRYRCVPPTP